MDATSALEAKKGHIADKVLKAGVKVGLNHPHLYDAYYDDLDIEDVKPVKPVIDLEEESESFKERQKTLIGRATAARNRIASLRSNKSTSSDYGSTKKVKSKVKSSDPY